MYIFFSYLNASKVWSPTEQRWLSVSEWFAAHMLLRRLTDNGKENGESGEEFVVVKIVGKDAINDVG